MNNFFSNQLCVNLAVISIVKTFLTGKYKEHFWKAKNKIYRYSEQLLEKKIKLSQDIEDA